MVKPRGLDWAEIQPGHLRKAHVSRRAFRDRQDVLFFSRRSGIHSRPYSSSPGQPSAVERELGCKRGRTKGPARSLHQDRSLHMVRRLRAL